MEASLASDATGVPVERDAARAALLQEKEENRSISSGEMAIDRDQAPLFLESPIENFAPETPEGLKVPSGQMSQPPTPPPVDRTLPATLPYPEQMIGTCALGFGAVDSSGAIAHLLKEMKSGFGTLATEVKEVKTEMRASHSLLDARLTTLEKNKPSARPVPTSVRRKREADSDSCNTQNYSQA